MLSACVIQFYNAVFMLGYVVAVSQANLDASVHNNINVPRISIDSQQVCLDHLKRWWEQLK